jgi:hypothetical protein
MRSRRASRSDATAVDEGTFVAECFWPGVTEGDLGDLDRRATTYAAEATRGGQPVRYLGSILMPADEVVLCRFEGGESAVRRVALAAAIPFHRIVETVQSPLDFEQKELS